MTGLAGKYAAALYIAGYKAKALDQIDNDLVEVGLESALVTATPGRAEEALPLLLKLQRPEAPCREQVWNTAAKSKEFRNFLKDPSIPKREKAESLDAVLGELQISEITKRFFGKGSEALAPKGSAQTGTSTTLWLSVTRHLDLAFTSWYG